MVEPLLLTDQVTASNFRVFLTSFQQKFNIYMYFLHHSEIEATLYYRHLALSLLAPSRAPNYSTLEALSGSFKAKNLDKGMIITTVTIHLVQVLH